jgi:tetratricopeptide (TPR) repeat protein
MNYEKSVKDQGLSLSILTALDQGGYREAIAHYESSEPTGDPVEAVWRAELALYLERLDDVDAELERIDEPLDRDLATRVEIVRAERAFYGGALEEARELVTPIVQSTWESGDDQGYLRALTLLGRIELRRDNLAVALEKLEEPRRLASLLGNDYFAGFIGHCRTLAYIRMGDYRRASQTVAEALPLLQKAEGGRWTASCRNVHGVVLLELARYEDALAEFEEAETASLELGIVSEALFARNNAAFALLLLDRHDEVIARLRDLLNWGRATSHVYPEIYGLMMLSMTFVELGRYAEAERCAQEVIQLARLTSSDAYEMDGELLRNWAAARSGRPEAAETLEQMIAGCDATGTPVHRAEVRLYLADALASSKPDVAAAFCAEARLISATDEDPRLRKLLHRIERSLAEGPVRIGPHGELVFDPRYGYPDYDAAVEALKRFLVFGAVKASEGNRSEAARKLNLTRSRLHDLWHQLNGEPIRPRRGADGDPQSAETLN